MRASGSGDFGVGRGGDVSRRGLLGAVFVGAVAVSLAGCVSSQESTGGGSSTSQGGVQAGGSAESSVAGSEEHYPNVPTDVVWDESARGEVEAAGKKAFTAFINVGSSQQAWWEGYGALLSPEYRDKAFYIDKDRITLTGFTKAEVVNEAMNPLSADVVFSTNDGVWVMGLNRQGQGQPWLVNKFSSSAGLGK